MPKYQLILVERLRNKLVSRGGRGVIGLGRQIRIFDDDGSGTLDKYEFKKAIRDFNIDIEDRDVDGLFKVFDRDSNGRIDFDEFLRTVVGEMNQFRRGLVNKVFEKLDTDESGFIELEEVKSRYNASCHPDVRSKKKTEDEVLLEFMETFEMHHNVWKGVQSDRRVSREEFQEYYNNISASVESDAYFDLMLANAWKMGVGTHSSQPYAGISSKIYEVDPKKIWTYDNHQNVITHQQPGNDHPSNSRYGMFATDSHKQGAGVTTYGSSHPVKEEAKQFGSDQDLLRYFREKMANRGARGILGLKRVFKVRKPNNNR